jgi:hypothetical protein
VDMTLVARLVALSLGASSTKWKHAIPKSACTERARVRLSDRGRSFVVFAYGTPVVTSLSLADLGPTLELHRHCSALQTPRNSQPLACLIMGLVWEILYEAGPEADYSGVSSPLLKVKFDFVVGVSKNCLVMGPLQSLPCQTSIKHAASNISNRCVYTGQICSCRERVRLMHFCN